MEQEAGSKVPVGDLWLRQERARGLRGTHKGFPVNILTFWRGLHKQSSGPQTPLHFAGCCGPL